MNETKISEIVRLYFHVKTLILYTEETDLLADYRTFIQPVMELRHAFDHLMRVYAAELKVEKSLSQDSANYGNTNLNKCRDHVYRAFFDTADWIAINLREKIIKTLSPYSHECINAVIPEYYKAMMPALNQLNQDITRIREKKDVADLEPLVEVEKYVEKIKELDAHMTTVYARVGSLQEYEARRERENIRSRRFLWMVGLVSAVVGALVGGAITLCFK